MKPPPFDTLRYNDRLRAVHIDEEAAKVLTEALADAMSEALDKAVGSPLAAGHDVRHATARDLRLLRWSMTASVVMLFVLFVKSFF